MLLESAARKCDDFQIKADDVRNILNWSESRGASSTDVPFQVKTTAITTTRSPAQQISKQTLFWGNSTKTRLAEKARNSISQKHDLRITKKLLVFWLRFKAGGSRQNRTGWALYSDYDVIILMTSLLLFYPTKKLGGQLPPLPTHPLPPC